MEELRRCSSPGEDRGLEVADQAAGQSLTEKLRLSPVPGPLHTARAPGHLQEGAAVETPRLLESPEFYGASLLISKQAAGDAMAARPGSVTPGHL